ncbi:MAG: protein kinase [Planctomycetaceae bacterium]
MPDLHYTEFLLLLKKSGLLTPLQMESAQGLVKTLRDAAKTSGSPELTAEVVATEFVSRNLITQWQANQLLKGQTGFVLEKYRLLTPVGKGGMGHVFRAVDTNSGATVAIKVMSRKLTGNQTLVNRFRREIRASSLLNNKHIVRTLDAGRVGKVDFMVMEYVNGDQVDRIVSRVSLIPVAMACDIVRQAAIGLQHAHEQKMVHRDLKPGNLIVDWSSDGNGVVKIMDMGLVRLSTDGEERTSVTKAGQVMGTPDYMSPEQGWDTATVDIRSDIYSLGCTLFRLLTGRVPFPGDNPLQVLMARCSKDAPSVKSLRADVPDPIDAIVRRMTLRDPAGRFQNPQELVDALEPFSKPLTVEGLKRALRDAGEDDAILLDLASAAENGDAQDAGYQQFLREMDSGAAVDLMLTTNGGQGQALNSTLPVLPQVDRRANGPRRPVKKKNSTAAVIALASASTLVALITLFVMVNRDTSDEKANPTTEANSNNTNPAVPSAKLQAIAPITVKPGTTVNYQPEFDGNAPEAPADGSLKFLAGSGTPAGVKIDETTGKVLWEIPSGQAAADYEITIELACAAQGATKVIASTKLVVTVAAMAPRFMFPDREPQFVNPGQEFKTRIIASPVPDTSLGLIYRLAPGAEPGMQLEATTGLFTWTPGEDQAGRHNVGLQLFDPSTSQEVARGSLSILVKPTFSLPTFPEQTATAGETFRLTLIERPPKFFGRAVRIAVKEGSPAGVTVDPRRAVLTWNVPADASGRYEIHLAPESLLPNLMMKFDQDQELVIVVNVKDASPMPAPSKVPAESDVSAAEAELRELFKRELSAAKSAVERASLANLLLDRSEEQTSSAADYALLDLVDELAEKSRAIDISLKVNRLRARRYGTDELTTAVELAAAFRSSSLNANQADTMIEQSLRLALAAATLRKYQDVAKLLGPPEQLLKKADKAPLLKQLADDVQNCRELADELSAENAVASDLKTSELLRRLEQWQFSDLFQDVNALQYVASGGSSIPNEGRGFWKIEPQRLRLEAPQQAANISVGIIDPDQDAGRYLVRMKIAAKSNPLMMIIGAGKEQNLNANLLSLDKQDFGRVLSVPGGQILNPPVSGINMPTTGSNEVEILVDGSQLNVRLNGVSAMSSVVPLIKPGRTGLLIPLQQTNMTSLEIRQARILILPDFKEK